MDIQRIFQYIIMEINLVVSNIEDSTSLRKACVEILLVHRNI